MAIQINFDLAGNPETPTFVLAHRNGNKIGAVEAFDIVMKDCLNSAGEVSFKVYKTLDGYECAVWESLVDFKLLWCKEWDTWFEITVELNDNDKNSIYKNISAATLCESELSQINLNGIEINTEDDIARDDYIAPTTFYNSDYPQRSLLNRISEKIPHYTWGHIDETLVDIQRTFSFDKTSIYDALQDIAEEIGCIFIFGNSSDSDGKPMRTIEAYDLMTYCETCKERNEGSEQCLSCGETDTSKLTQSAFGKDTSVFVSRDCLASEITYEVDTDSVKNCFKLEAGDDLMTATVKGCNPNGSEYIWHIADSAREDMSDDLQKALADYDTLYQTLQEEGGIAIQKSKPSSDSEFTYYIPNTLITYWGNYEYKYRQWLTELGKEYTISYLQTNSYPRLLQAYYATVDILLVLESGLMPLNDHAGSAEEALSNLQEDKISPVGIAGLTNNTSIASIETYVRYALEAVLDSYYEIDIKTDTDNSDYKEWSGSVTVTSINDSEDTATGDIAVSLSNYTDCTPTYIKAKLLNAIKSKDVGEGGITSLFAYKTDSSGQIQLDENEQVVFKKTLDEFEDTLEEYCANSLVSFRNACQTILDILMEQGMGDKSSEYYSLYKAYYDRLQAIEDELDTREEQIANMQKLQNYIADIRTDIQNKLDMENYLGTVLWKELCSYRREDTYSNSNYVSDGLSNTELTTRAQEFLQAANIELYKSGEKQHKISATLNNLLLMDEFKPLLDSFSVGNFIRIEVDGEIYKLRLIEYKIDFDNLDSLDVTFSDVVNITGGVSDIASILKQAKSMATSYESVTRQAKSGDESKAQLTHWVNDGLDVTNTNIVNTTDNNVMTYDEHGILMREYDPATQTYSQKQVKITNKGMYVTDDAWETAKVGVGNFIYYDPADKDSSGNLKAKEGYGIIADTLIGNLILGQEIGIYTSSGDISMDANGITVTNAQYKGENKTTTVSINPNSDNPFCISYGGSNVFYISSKGSAYVKGRIEANSGTIGGFAIGENYIDNSVMTLDTNGLTLKYGAKDSDYQITDIVTLGRYGVNVWENNTKQKGMTVDVESDCSYIAWGVKSDKTGTYNIKLMYTQDKLKDSKYGDYAADRLHLGTFLDLSHYGFSYGNYESTTIDNGNIIYLLYTKNKDSNTDVYKVPCRILQGVIMHS